MTLPEAQTALGEARAALYGRGAQLAGLCGLAFLTIGSYELARPAAESLFLGAYGQEGLPWVWLCVACAALVVVGVYNRLASRLPILTMLVGAAATSVVLLTVLLTLELAAVPWAPFALYVFKDLYVVVLVEAFWSMANLHFHTATARWSYGLFCAAGSLGAIVGGLVVGPLAARVGTASTLWAVVGLLLIIGVAATGFGRDLGVAPPATNVAATLPSTVRLVRRSAYVGLMILLVTCTQLSITLIDYVFNGTVAAAYPVVDERTRVIGIIYSGTAFVALVLQLATGVVLKKVGVPRTLLALPLLLFVSVLAFVVTPAFALVAAAKIASKSFDYSLFRAAKEMLYIPLGYREKTEGKTVVDVLTYRVTKGLVSVLLLALAALSLSGFASWLTLVAVVGWMGLAVVIGRRYRRLTAGAASGVVVVPEV
ncbi:MAG: hypothetical protein HY903_01085 [Deltaproteobacteria bacterium]|nr:hypothetical protein [Deltaproteobacteria bacterium]